MDVFLDFYSAQNIAKSLQKATKSWKSHNASQYIKGTYALHSAGRINLWITPLQYIRN